MEHLQQFEGSNRSCRNGLARRRQKSLLRHQLQQEVERQRQALQAMHEMYEQQQQQQQQLQQQPVEQDHLEDAFWDTPSWQRLQEDWVVPQAPEAAAAAAACNGTAWTTDAAAPCDPCMHRCSSRSSASEGPVLAVPPVTAPDQSAVPVCNYSINNMQCGAVQATLLPAEGNATLAAAACRVPSPMPGMGAAPFGSSNAGTIGVFRAGSVDQQQAEQALCLAGGAASPAGLLHVPASISDDELGAIIAEELQAAGLQIQNEAAGRPAGMLVGAASWGGSSPAATGAACFQPAAAPAAMHLLAGAAAPAPALLPAAVPGVVSPIPPGFGMHVAHRAAQYAKLQALMAEYNDLSATLQQLQKGQGWGQQTASGLTRY
jgi:hypothetical protein